jgi:hypothetical protein
MSERKKTSTGGTLFNNHIVSFTKIAFGSHESHKDFIKSQIEVNLKILNMGFM